MEHIQLKHCSIAFETFTNEPVGGTGLSLSKPAVITYHIWVEATLLSSFYHWNIVVESFSMFIIYLAQVKWKKEYVMPFHSLALLTLNRKIGIIFSSVRPKKVPYNLY